MTKFRLNPTWWLPLTVLTAAGIVHAFASPIAEPFKNGDETRHVMTGVFVRDAIFDLPVSANDFDYDAVGCLLCLEDHGTTDSATGLC